jgi:hypothetical protein
MANNSEEGQGSQRADDYFFLILLKALFSSEHNFLLQMYFMLLSVSGRWNTEICVFQDKHQIFLLRALRKLQNTACNVTTVVATSAPSVVQSWNEHSDA